MFLFIISSLNNKINTQSKLIEKLQYSINSLKNQSTKNNININNNISSLEKDNISLKKAINLLFNALQFNFGIAIDSTIIKDDIYILKIGFLQKNIYQQNYYLDFQEMVI